MGEKKYSKTVGVTPETIKRLRVIKSVYKKDFDTIIFDACEVLYVKAVKLLNDELVKKNENNNV